MPEQQTTVGGEKVRLAPLTPAALGGDVRKLNTVRRKHGNGEPAFLMFPVGSPPQEPPKFHAKLERGGGEQTSVPKDDTQGPAPTTRSPEHESWPV